MSTSETVKNAARELYADSGISSTVSEGLDNIDRLARLAEREAIIAMICTTFRLSETAEWKTAKRIIQAIEAR